MHVHTQPAKTADTLGSVLPVMMMMMIGGTAVGRDSDDAAPHSPAK